MFQLTWEEAESSRSQFVTLDKVLVSSRGAREHPTRPPTSRLPLTPDHRAVDDHRVDAFRALNRLREGRRFVDFIFIEHDDIRGETLLQDAPVREPEGLRRETGHFVNCTFQRKKT